MATFTYQAKDNSGKSLSGLIEAATPRNAAAALREQGLWPTRIEPAKVAPEAMLAAEPSPFSDPTPREAPGAPPRIHAAPFLVEIPIPDLAIFYRQFATLQRAGVPMVQAMMTLSEQTRNGRLRAILKEAAGSIASGHAFSETLRRHPGVFTTLQIELIRAGETSGLLDQMCERIADYLERELETRRKLKRETLYPKIVLFVAGLTILVVGFARAGMGQAGIAVVVERLKFAAGVATIVGVGWWLARFSNQFPAVGATWDYVKLLIPGPGGVARRYATARFTRALGALYGGGVLLPRAVEIAARACGNRAIGQRMQEGVPTLLSGGGLSAMLGESGLLAPVAVQMARTGEQTGSLDAMMDKVADYLESEADTKAHQLAVIAGVLALLIAALVVGAIVISFYVGVGSMVQQQGAE